MALQTRDRLELFTCTRCGDCCRGFGGTVVTDEDVSRIAEHIGVAEAAFRSAYCQMSGTRAVLAQAENGYCVFWDELCTIHPVKPKMCRAWPFIPAILLDVVNWHSMASTCPGMRTDVTDDRILETVRRIVSTD